MNNRHRYISVLAVGGLLISLVLALSRHTGAAQGFPLLFLPWIILAGYWEGLYGSLGATVWAAGFLAGMHAFGWMPEAHAAVYLISCGLVFVLGVLFVQGYDAWQKEEAGDRLPQEAKLMRVERKARLIRGQIEEYERRLRNLTHLYEATKRLMGIMDLSVLMDEARTLVGKTFQQHFSAQSESEARVAFYLPDEETGVFKRYASQGHEISDEGMPEQFMPEVLRGWLGETFGPVRVRDVRRDPRFQALFEGAATSLLIVPLVMHEILIGLLLIGSSRENAFSAAEFNQAAVLGKQIVFALRKAFLYRKVQMLSITDNLTGLYVHRHFQDRLREELHRAERYRHFLSLILLDLDHFKRVNDTHGHPTGDAVLTEVADRLKRTAGATALVARYGGEEFAILLPNATKAKALQVAALLNEVVKSSPIGVGGTSLTITLSAGVSTYPEDALTQDTVITTADTALYDAKRNGRDMVVGFSRLMKEKNI